MNLPAWVTRISTIWASIGVLLAVFGGQGIELPAVITNIFSQAFVDAVITFTGSAIAFYQFIRTLTASKSDVKSLATPTIGHYLNPFKSF